MVERWQHGYAAGDAGADQQEQAEALTRWLAIQAWHPRAKAAFVWIDIGYADFGQAIASTLDMKTFLMKLSVGALMICGPAILTSLGQTAKDDIKDAGHDTKQAAKDTGSATKKTAKKAGHNVKKGTKKAVNKGAQETDKGAAKVEKKTDH